MSSLRGGLVLAGRNLTLWRRNPSSVVGTFVFPLVFLLGFSVVLRRTMELRGLEYDQYLPPVIVVQAMFFAAIASAFWLCGDRLAGLLDRFRSLPIGRSAVVVARALADGARALGSLAAVVLGAMALGFRFEAGLPAALGFVVVALLFALVVAAGCSMVGLRSSDPQAAISALFLPYLPLLMLSTGFVPVEGFPGWLQPFVRHQPVSLTVDALRALASGGPTTELVVRALAALAALLLVFGALGARTFRRLA